MVNNVFWCIAWLLIVPSAQSAGKTLTDLKQTYGAYVRTYCGLWHGKCHLSSNQVYQLVVNIHLKSEKYPWNLSSEICEKQLLYKIEIILKLLSVFLQKFRSAQLKAFSYRLQEPAEDFVCYRKLSAYYHTFRRLRTVVIFLCLLAPTCIPLLLINYSRKTHSMAMVTTCMRSSKKTKPIKKTENKSLSGYGYFPFRKRVKVTVTFLSVTFFL